MKLRKIISVVCAAALTVSAMCTSLVFASDTRAADTFTDLNQTQITQAMAAGWNLGNQLEASNGGTPSETAWGNPVITKKLIQTVKDAGYSTIRIPVSYLNKIGDKASGYKIDSAWLARVKEVVDYAYDIGMYVIINMHGDGYYTVDGGWLLCAESDDKQVEIKEKYKACWEQISTAFKDYDEHLIFESMNEEFDGKYSGQQFSAYDNINAYNQIFVDTVRQTGGNNAKRWLLIPGWNTDIDQTVYPQGGYSFKIPTDNYLDSSINGKRIMVSVHYYGPWDFAGDGTSTRYTQWGSEADPNKSAGYQNKESDMENQIKKVYDKFVKSGYPVVIGECGCINKSSADPKNTYFRAHWVNTMFTYAKQYGCIPVYWDNGASSNSFGLINRGSCKIVFPELIDAMVSVYSTDEENVNRAISFAKACVEKDYTAETWKPFSTALTNAEKVVAASDSVKYASAYDSLIDAYFKLEEAGRAANVKPVAKTITEVVYNITSTGDEDFMYQYCDANADGDYPTFTINVKSGTNDYVLTPEFETTGFWNLGFANLPEGSSNTMLVNSVTINGYTFDSSDLKIGNVLTSDGSNNGMINIWQGISGTFDSTDKAACIVATANSKLEFCVYEEVDDPIPPEPETYAVSGVVKVSDSDTSTDMTVTAVSAEGKETSVSAKSMGNYSIADLEAGTYTLKISGGKYVEKTYEITVTDGDLAMDVNLNPLGDINGDGKVTTADVGMANSHAKGINILEGYKFECADAKIDGAITTADVGMINSHAKGIKALW